MENKNFLEDFQAEKQKIVALADKAFSYGWITDSQKAEFVNKIEQDVLTIGVIGQMKCGKSTFLNAFVFEKDILPAATTPMTASLSVITYGEKEEISAEFYTKDEWAEQKQQADRNEEDASDELEKSKIRAAKELVKASSRLPDLENYLGKTQKDSLEKLEDYVGSDGKFVSITKSVKITLAKEYLKGVEIVDTPGMNDPIASREERTREFLKKADVVLLILYAGRPFDTTDRNILFEDVKKCGMGKILIGINKYDIPYMDGESEDEILGYVKNEITRASKDFGDDSINDILKDVSPVMFSAEMALLSELPSEIVSGNDVYSTDWNRYCDNFEISSKSQFREKSRIDELIAQVQKVIDKKSEILFTKPENAIKAAGQNKKIELEKIITKCNNELKALEMSDSEIDDQLHNIEGAEKKIIRKMGIIKSGLKDKFDEKLPDIGRNLKNKVNEKCGIMRKIVENWTIGSDSVESIRNKLDRIMIYLMNDLQESYEDSQIYLKKELKNSVSESFDKINDIISDKLPDFDFTDFIEGVNSKIKLDVDLNAFSDITKLFEKQNFDKNIKKGFDNWFVRGARREEIADKINEFEKDFCSKINDYLSPFKKEADKCIQLIEDEIIKEDIVTPLREMLDKCKKDKDKHDETVKATKEKLEKAKQEKQELERQIMDISA